MSISDKEVAMDDLIRIATFNWLEKQKWQHGGIFPRSILEQGFNFQGHRITLAGPQGIWKPAVMELPLSISTTPGSRYDDQLLDSGMLIYSYRGTDPYHRDNVGLRTVMHKGIPLAYFVGIEPSKYLAEWPVYVVNDNPSQLKFTIAFDERSALVTQNQNNQGNMLFAEAYPDTELRRRYATAQALIRLHQGEFRIRVLSAYKEQCAFCRLRHQQLLDAAHIIPDGEDGGEPIVPNGLSLCKIHHAAFDNNIVGLKPDYKIIVREDILEEIDGPMLKYGIQEMHEQKIILPRKSEHWPDRERLELRFNNFLKAG
jgi:putative restriction endonuclease